MSTFQKPLLEFFEAKDRIYDDLEDALKGCETMDIVYEQDIQENPKVAYDKCCHFIGMKSVNPEIKLKRSTPQSLSQILKNYEEVRKALKGTKYEWMLEED